MKHPKYPGSDRMSVEVERGGYAANDDVAIHARATSAPDTRAQFAMACVERWGMVAAEGDGEDSAGRHRLRRATPDEVVEHAISVTEALFDRMEERGWMVAIPTFEEAREVVYADKNA